MITIKEYAKPKSIDEAYALLTSDNKASVIGGGAWQRLGSKTISLAIDLSGLDLSFITETEQTLEIGAMTTVGELERYAGLGELFDGVIPKTVSHIVGTQMRNLVTVGGTVYGRFGFSELITSLLVLECDVVLHKNGTMSMKDFLSAGVRKDILTKIILQKKDMRASYHMFRNTSGSLPIMAVAVSKSSGQYKIAVGARPGVANLANEAMTYLNSHEASPEEIEQAAIVAAEELSFGKDRKASKEYRQEICKMLIKRAVAEVQ